MAEPVTPEELAARDDLADWQVVSGGLQATFACASFSAAGALIARFAEAADAADHHPDLTLTYPGVVGVRLVTHSAGGLTDLDARLAVELSAIAASAGAHPAGRSPDAG